MKVLTKAVTEKHMSIKDIEQELLFATDGNSEKREQVLLATVQELASAVISIKEELKFNRY